MERRCQRKFNKTTEPGTTYRVKCSQKAAVTARYRYRASKGATARTVIHNFCQKHLTELTTRKGVSNIVVEITYPHVDGVPV